MAEGAGLAQEELERLIFFEAAKEQAKLEVKKNPKDVQALIRWGGALLELAHLKQGSEAVQCIEEAIEKVESALEIDPRRHEALWCLGNAYTSQGFLHATVQKAQEYFDRAQDCFKKAVKEDPANEVYKKALEMNAKAPQLHAQIQKQLQAQQEQVLAEQQKLAAASTDYLYDVAGWFILVGLGIGLAVLSKATSPPGPGP
uniref:Mitochondrial import receptor subunit TOM20 n=1 Tax=Chloropicon laureae TaxID=464258 RepID=A0A7S2YU29_9CHLO|mmetsp:Transcript_5570/g.11855  ORF Transcript_5570/g.11855 Transcript_5570/m.11855 type:complete len:201 (+) Transcript_5570:122-724(+)